MGAYSTTSRKIRRFRRDTTLTRLQPAVFTQSSPYVHLYLHAFTLTSACTPFLSPQFTCVLHGRVNVPETITAGPLTPGKKLSLSQLNPNHHSSLSPPSHPPPPFFPSANQNPIFQWFERLLLGRRHGNPEHKLTRQPPVFRDSVALGDAGVDERGCSVAGCSRSLLGRGRSRLLEQLTHFN